MRELSGRLGLQIWRQQTHLHGLLLGNRPAHRAIKGFARREQRSNGSRGGARDGDDSLSPGPITAVQPTGSSNALLRCGVVGDRVESSSFMHSPIKHW
jgi:hypothetical protein